MTDKYASHITVQETSITVISVEKTDYICLTDMAKARTDETRAADVIKNWLRNRATLEFLGTWEVMYNPSFKVVEFDHFKSEAGLHTFTLSAKEWIEKTNAIGMYVQSGRYGGTYAHKDIAFEFGSAISPVFKLYLIKEYQRLKDEENDRLKLEWSAKRFLSKNNYLIHAEQNYVIDPVTAPLVMEVFRRYADGETAAAIMNDFNARGLKTSIGGTFNKNSFHKMLHNRRYIGEYHFRDIVIPNGIPQIIPDELFERVQERLSRNKRMPAHDKAAVEYLLTTKLYCGKCGAYLIGESGTSKTGKVHNYYKCVHAKRGKTCKKKSVHKDWIEDIVVDNTVKTALNDAMIKRIADKAYELQLLDNSDLPALRGQLKEINRSIDNMLNAIQQGIITASTKQRLDELEETKENIAISIAQAEIQKPVLTKEEIIFWISGFKLGDKNNPEYRRRLIDTFVNAVYLYDDRIVLTYNYKDGSQTITLSEVMETFGNKALGSDLTDLGVPSKKIIRQDGLF